MKYTQKTDYTVNGECPTNCGKCCTSILPLTLLEIERIRDYMKENDIEFNNPNNIFSAKYQDVCPFLNGEKRCSIYPVRPEVCQVFVCDTSNKHYTHVGKHIINMISTFGPSDTFLPADAPNVEQLDKDYQQRKKSVGLN